MVVYMRITKKEQNNERKESNEVEYLTSKSKMY